MNLIKIIENGSHLACERCPWNPKKRKNNGTAFGVSCIEHGVDWTKPVSAASMLIAQDPAGTTPEKTGKLCGFCNTKFSTDHSANHGFSLWKAAVSLTDDYKSSNLYMKNHYWTNAIMHGVKESNQREEARKHCSVILLEQINFLSPRVIISCGKDAAKSLFDIGLISKPWDVFKNEFNHTVYRENYTLPSGIKSTVFCTYHGSATAVNTHIARQYSMDTEKLLTAKFEILPDPLPAHRFLSRHNRLNGEDMGMRVLLLHWLDIGVSIRKANQDFN